MEIMKKILLSLGLIGLVISQVSWAGEQERNQAKRIHDRLTGISASNATITAMEYLLLNDDATGKSAAEYAISITPITPNPDPDVIPDLNPTAWGFYNITLKNYATPWTNEEQTVFTPLNDYSAMVIGTIRDDLDFRSILYDDLLYIGKVPGLSDYSNLNNNHYEQLEALDPDPDADISGNLANPAILVKTTQSEETLLDTNATAGIMTSRAGAMAFFSDGTNRAMLRFTLINHLCTDLEPLKDVSRIPDRVRRDVTRSPGGDSRIFQNGCVGCHAGMDGLAGAFAYYEWDYPENGNKSSGSLEYTFGSVSEKHNINATSFEYGYETIDDSWINYWRNGPNSTLASRSGASGWEGPNTEPDSKGNATGNGAKSLGIELAHTKAFAQCQVDKAFKAICLRDPNSSRDDRDKRDDFVGNFSDSNFNMRGVFTDVAAYCKGE